MIYFIYRYHTNFLDIHLQSCFLPNCSNFDLKLQLKISIGLSTLLWDTIWIHIQNCCFNSPFVGFQNRCLPGLLFFLVSFFCTLFDLWMCSVYNALGSEWLKWKQCKPTQLAKPCLIGKISCFFYHDPFYIIGERIILHTREGWRNKESSCTLCKNGLISYVWKEIATNWNFDLVGHFTLRKLSTSMHSFCGQYYCSDMEPTRILHDTNPGCIIHSILSSPVADWSKWDLCLIWLSWMYTDPPRTPITNQYHLPLQC